jgi:RNA polymerase sigma-70 factor (ECF subfamily)
MTALGAIKPARALSHSRAASVVPDVSTRGAPCSAAHPSSGAGDAAKHALLVARLRQGEPAAFEAAYDAYRARIHSFLLRLTRDAASAHDLTQEVWLRLAARARQLRADTDLGAWLFTVARNLFISQRRWRLLDRERLAAFGLAQSRPELPTPLELAVGSAIHAQLDRAIAALPVKYREVLLLVSVEGFSIEDVARMLNLRADAVRQRLSRARTAIRSALDTENAAGSREQRGEKP